MASDSLHADYAHLVKQFCAVTGADAVTGQHLLEACNGDVEMAIGMHMDGAGSSGLAAVPVEAASCSRLPDSSRSATPSESSASSFADFVRAPIPQTTEVLVENNIVYGRNNRRRKNTSVFDAFRDFQAETRQQMLVVNGSDSSSVKRRTLEDLFRPPLDLLHKGSFRSACDVGKAMNRWLLVNVQNVQEFACQMLNRDVWSNTTVKEVVKAHFVLWQVYSDSEEGKKYMQFYDVDAWPYIAVLDPRTGEKLVVWHNVDAASFYDIISEFLLVHPVPNEDRDSSPPEKRTKHRESILDTSEDSQLKAALAASLSSCQYKPAVRCNDLSYSDDDDNDEGSDTDELETFTDSDSEQSTTVAVTTAAANKVKTNIVSCPTNESQTMLQSSSSSSSSSTLPSQDVNDSSGQASDGGRDLHQLRHTTSAAVVALTESVVVDERVADTVTDSKSWKCYLGPESDPMSNIVFRFPDGVRKTLSLPCSSELQALSSYVGELGFPAEHYELVTTFPRRNLSLLNTSTTLRNCGLYPQDTVFVQERSSTSPSS
jgi:hypothetical protein